ncbi:MAG: hypothetical protein A2096_00945 [Spirochaetes bacterium GWF1_41_5]|nr:MAG: hypothetical protein A2096_00945 [Spirochaetes bacterium GWF1_41_5]HBE04144.1 hypothetical protein [Spirochaetia bacterium]
MPDKKKWYMWALFLPAHFFATYQSTIISVAGAEITGWYGISGAVAGILAGAYFFAYAVMQIPNGILTDRFGPRRLAAFGGIILGLAAIIFTFPVGLGNTTLLRFLTGFGASFGFIAIMRWQSNWFSRAQFPVVSGLTAFIGNLGVIFGSGPSVYLNETIGWKNLQIVLGSICVISSILVFFRVKDHPDKSSAGAPYPIFRAFRTLFADKRSYLSAGAFGASFGMYTVLSSLWGAFFFIHVYGLSSCEAASYLVFLPAGVALGSLASGFMARLFKGEQRAVLVLLSLANAGWGILIFLRIHNAMLWIYRPFFLLIGLCGASSLLVYTTVSNYTPREMRGAAIAFTGFGGLFIASILQPLCGMMLDRSLQQTIGGIIKYSFSAYQKIFIMLFLINCAGVFSYWLVIKKTGLMHNTC